jgi:hypothetical protein
VDNSAQPDCLWMATLNAIEKKTEVLKSAGYG